MSTKSLRLSDLPPELWQNVVDHLPLRSRSSCLLVSRFFHDLAMRSVFSTVHVYFGSWETFCGLLTDDRDYKSIQEKNSGRSYSILSRIIRDSAFAALIKTIHIYGFADELATFEQNCIADAVASLSDLRSLHWHGPSPAPTSQLVEILVASSTLRRITIPLPLLKGLSLHRLDRLQYIALPIDPHEALDADITDLKGDFLALMQSNRATLRELVAPGPLFWDCPIYVLRDLTHLELRYPLNLSNMELLFRHSSRLESLTVLFTNHETPAAEFWGVLARNPRALPALTSLKLHTATHVQADHSLAIANFTKEKKLRRFDCYSSQASWEEIDSLLSLFKDSTTLRTLGLDLPGGCFTGEDLDGLAEYLPKDLTALRLSFSRVDELHVGDAVVDMLSSFPKLRFVYIDDEVQPLGVSDESLMSGLKNVELLARNGSYLDVEWQDEDVLLTEWAPNRAEYGTAEDFGCEDWEWLMRNHPGISALDEDDEFE